MLIDRVQERRAARIDNLKQLERDIAKDIEKLSLKCGCNNHTKDFKKPCKQNLPKTKRLRKIGESSRMSKAVAKVKPFVRKPSPAPSIIDIVSERDDSDNENGPISMEIEVTPRVGLLPPPSVEFLPPPSVEVISQAGHSMEELPPPSVEFLPPPSVEVIPQAGHSREELPQPSVESFHHPVWK